MLHMPLNMDFTVISGGISFLTQLIDHNTYIYRCTIIIY